MQKGSKHIYDTFPTLKNEYVLDAIKYPGMPRTPVWIMREPGNYWPEYQNKWAPISDSFYEHLNSPALVCEATLSYVRQYNVDAVILFSDLLIIPYVLGMKVYMKDLNSPVLMEPLSEPEDVNKLKKTVDLNRELLYVYEAVSLTRHQLNGAVPLIGLAGAPWTLMCYMIEGGYSRDRIHFKPKSWLFKWPEQSHVLLRLLKDTVITHLVNQVVAGAQLLQLFETNAECLSPKLFKEFSLPYLKEIKESVTSKVEEYLFKMVPMILYTKGSSMVLDLVADLDYDVFSVDSTIDPSAARSKIPRTVTLQGNLDTSVLSADHKEIKERVIKMLKGFTMHHYIANLGDSIAREQNIPSEKIAYFVDVVHAESSKLYKEWKKNR